VRGIGDDSLMIVIEGVASGLGGLKVLASGFAFGESCC